MNVFIHPFLNSLKGGLERKRNVYGIIFLNVYNQGYGSFSLIDLSSVIQRGWVGESRRAYREGICGSFYTWQVFIPNKCRISIAFCTYLKQKETEL